MSARFTLPGLLLSALLLPAVASAAHPNYTVHVVGVPGSVAVAINASGAVAGNYPYTPTETRGFVNTGTALADVGTLGGETYVRDINDGGEVVGFSFLGDGKRRAFRSVDGAIDDLGTLGGEQSIAHGINNRGDIVGWASLAESAGGGGRAFLLRRGTSMQDLGRFEVPDAEGDSVAYAVNNKRQVVGASALGPYVPVETPFPAFLYACEEMKNLGTLGGQTSTALAINDKGQIVGDASTPEFRHNHAFLYHRGVLRDIDTMPGSEGSAALDINERGQVVGAVSGWTGSTRWERGFLYQDGTMRSLNSLLTGSSGWSILAAGGINATGQIAATGCKAGVCYALRLDPVP